MVAGMHSFLIEHPSWGLVWQTQVRTQLFSIVPPRTKPIVSSLRLLMVSFLSVSFLFFPELFFFIFYSPFKVLFIHKISNTIANQRNIPKNSLRRKVFSFVFVFIEIKMSCSIMTRISFFQERKAPSRFPEALLRGHGIP